MKIFALVMNLPTVIHFINAYKKIQRIFNSSGRSGRTKSKQLNGISCWLVYLPFRYSPFVARVPLVRNLDIPSAPGAAERRVVREDEFPISAPSWRFDEEPKAGGGVKEPEASPRGLGEAVTVPTEGKKKKSYWFKLLSWKPDYSKKKKTRNAFLNTFTVRWFFPVLRFTPTRIIKKLPPKKKFKQKTLGKNRVKQKNCCMHFTSNTMPVKKV